MPKYINGDFILSLALALKGDVYYLNDLTSVYRKKIRE